jgi:hypothetical protein
MTAQERAPRLRSGSAYEPRPVRLGLSGLAIASFVVGLTYTVKVSLVGEASLAEFLLPLLGVAALTQQGAQRVLTHRTFLALLAALLVTLAGYVISDMVAESSAEQYLRGWGRVLIVLTDFVALALLVGAQRQALWWFLAGMGLGRVLFLRLVMHEPISMWKFASDYSFGYAEPLTLLAIAACCKLNPRIGGVVLVMVALCSIGFDFRSHAAVCMVVAGVLWMRAGAKPQHANRLRVTSLAIAGGLAGLLLWGGLQLTADDYTSQRRGASDIGRALGKVFALKAIEESPLLGYGSWSRNREFLALQQAALAEVAGEDAEAFAVGDSSSAVHSMVLQAWVEGGFLGAVFFLVLGGMMLGRLQWLLLVRLPDPLYPFLLYFIFIGMWHIVMSPFAAPLRIHLACAATAVVCMALERGAWRARPASTRKSSPVDVEHHAKAQ